MQKTFEEYEKEVTQELTNSLQANIDQKNEVDFDFCNLQLMYNGQVVSYSEQTLLAQGLEINLPNSQKQLFDDSQCLLFDEKVVMDQYCTEVVESFNRIINPAFIDQEKKEKKQKEKLNQNSLFQLCIKLLQKVPKSIDYIENLLTLLPYGQIQILLENNEFFIEFFKLLHQIIYKKQLESEMEQNFLLMIENDQKIQTRIMMIISFLPFELNIVGILFSIMKTLIHIELDDDNFEDQFMKKYTLDESLDYLIKIIKSVFRLCSSSRSSCEMVRYIILRRKMVLMLKKKIEKTFFTQEIIIKFLSFLSLICHTSEDIVDEIYVGNEKEFQIIFLSYFTNQKLKNNLQFRKDQFYFLLNKMLKLKQCYRIVEKVPKYILQTSPFLDPEEIKIISKFMQKNKYIKLFSLQNFLTKLEAMVNTLYSINWRTLKKYERTLREILKVVKYQFEEEYDFHGQFIKKLGRTVKRCGKPVEGSWISLVRQLKYNQYPDDHPHWQAYRKKYLILCENIDL